VKVAHPPAGGARTVCCTLGYGISVSWFQCTMTNSAVQCEEEHGAFGRSAHGSAALLQRVGCCSGAVVVLCYRVKSATKLDCITAAVSQHSLWKTNRSPSTLACPQNALAEHCVSRDSSLVTLVHNRR